MLALYHIDAFTNRVFKGNSACVVILQEELPYQTLLNIAKENAVAETAFILTANNTLSLRWFTPDLEMDLCGHATLAAAFVIFNYYPHFITKEYITFSTQEGNINVIRELNGNDNYIYTLNFPIREGIKADLPQIIQESLSIQPKEVYLSRDYHLVYESQKDILNLEIDRDIFDKINLGQGGVVVSAKGEDCDFVSRFFTPQATILEDPVTGSAHCTLAPYWSNKLNKTNLYAKQL